MKGTKTPMGIGASQARLLSITARLTDNEMASQSITNAKVRLASKTQDASNEYMNALSSTQLMYASYNDKGERAYQKLTSGSVMTYGSLKNQYGLINTNNQILVLDLDKKNYQDSKILNEFLDKYGLIDLKDVTKDNPEWVKQATTIYGSGYGAWLDEANVSSWYDKVNNGTKGWLGEGASVDGTGKVIPTVMTDEQYRQWASLPWLEGMDFGSRNKGGVFGDWETLLENPPANVGAKPTPPDVWDIAQDLLSPACWGSTNIDGLRNGSVASDDNVWHMEHVLSQYLWDPNQPSGTGNSPNNGTLTAHEYDAEGNITGTYTITNASGTYAMSSGGGNGEDPKNVRGILNKPENAELKRQLIDMYYQIAKHIQANNTNDGLTSGSITTDGNTQPTMSAEDIGKAYVPLINDLLMAVVKDDPAIDDAEKEYEEEMKAYEERLKAFQEWFSEVEIKRIALVNELHLPDKTITEKEGVINDKDKADWYTNLWYRMGGLDAEKDVTLNHKEPGDNKYTVIDSAKLNNAEWLQFALEQGLITFEQVTFKQEGSDDYPNMKDHTWQSCLYTSASDITEQDNQAAVTKAEVKYQSNLREIQIKDKKYDQDLKKLDTEHTAMQTEYESVKGVISKNVERSFKAFS